MTADQRMAPGVVYGVLERALLLVAVVANVEKNIDQ